MTPLQQTPPPDDRPLYLSADDCRAVLGPDDVVAAIEETLTWEAAGSVRWSEPRSLRMVDKFTNSYHLKACVLEPGKVAGVRLVAHPEDERSGTSTRWVVLLDASTSRPLAVVDETWNYAQRTVAVMAVVARRLAVSRPATLALVGAGRLAEAALTYYARLFDLMDVRIASRRPESRGELARRAREDSGLPAQPAASIEEAVVGADLVLTCTSAGKSLLEDRWVAPGAVVASLDTAEPGRDFYAKADLVVVDSREQLQGELVECFGPEAPRRVAATFSDIVARTRPGRTSPEQRILAISQGLASLDVAMAFQAYRLARSKGLGWAFPA